MTKIKDAMVREIITIDENATVEEACRLMGDKHIGSVVTSVNGEPKGIFTERDLLSRVIALGVDIRSARVKDFSSTPLITVDPDYDAREAAKIMRDMGCKRLLVRKNGKIVGIFTTSELVKVISESPVDF